MSYETEASAMAKKTPAWSVKRHLHVMHDRILDNYDEVMAENIADVTNWIRKPSPPTQVHPEGETPGTVGVSLYGIGRLLAEHGCERVLSGDANGWAEIAKSLPILYWVRRIELQIAHSWFQRTKKKEQLEDRLAFATAFGLTFALGYDEGAQWLGEKLLADVGSHTNFKSSWDWSPVSPFVYRLAAKWLKKKVDPQKLKTDRNCPAYDAIWEHWKDPTKLGAACDEAAEYHVANGNTVRERDLMDFIVTHGEPIPWEILAVLRLRRAEGLADPPFSHPFLLSPLMNPPLPLTFKPDKLLDQAIGAARKQYPDL